MGFVETYFYDPVYYGTGYNIVNTAVYALILIAAVFVVFRALKRYGVKIDRNFLIGVSPFVALGGVLRAWEDLAEATGTTLPFFSITDAYGVNRNLLLITPFIYFTVFIIAVLFLAFSRAASKESYWKTWLATGALLDILLLTQLRFVNSFGFLVMSGLTIFWLLAIIAARKLSKGKIHAFFTPENSLILLVHMFDASTTFTALTFYPYFEQHVLPSFLISIFGPWIMFLLKLVVVSAVLYLFDKDMNKKEDAEKKTFLKLIVLILGLGPGLRNFLRITMGV